MGEFPFTAAFMLEEKAQRYLLLSAFGLQNETVQFFGLDSIKKKKNKNKWR